jgi:hypothetical protein
MSSAELSEWLAFESIYGIPDVYFQTAAICSTLDSVWREHPRKIHEVIPYFTPAEGADPIGQSPAEMFARLRTYSSMQKK